MNAEPLPLIYFNLDCFIIIGHFNKAQKWEVTELYWVGAFLQLCWLTLLFLSIYVFFFEIVIFVHINALKETIYHCEILITAFTPTTAIFNTLVKLVDNFN